MEAEPPRLTALPASLAEVRIERLPSHAYYIADFVSEEEEQRLLDKVGSRLLPRVIY
jgi:alkylated DNA repair protein alkB family protein 6